jgi:hypothetical protein
MQKHSGTKQRVAAAASRFPTRHAESLQRLGSRHRSSTEEGVLSDDLWGGISTGTKYVMPRMNMRASCGLMMLTVAEQLN